MQCRITLKYRKKGYKVAIAAKVAGVGIELTRRYFLPIIWVLSTFLSSLLFSKKTDVVCKIVHFYYLLLFCLRSVYMLLSCIYFPLSTSRSCRDELCFFPPIYLSTLQLEISIGSVAIGSSIVVEVRGKILHSQSLLQVSKYIRRTSSYSLAIFVFFSFSISSPYSSTSTRYCFSYLFFSRFLAYSPSL